MPQQLTDPDVWLAQKQGQQPQSGGGLPPAPITPAGGGLTDPDAWMSQHANDPMTAFSKAQTIGPHKRTWYENLVGSLPAIPAAIQGARTGASIGALGGPWGAGIGGFIGGVGGAYLGGAGGDLGFAEPLSEWRRGVIDPVPQQLHMANQAGEAQAVGEAIGRPATAIAGKLAAPFAGGMTVRGKQVLDRFRTPLSESSVTSVLPSDVTESRAANAFEKAGRSSMFGGAKFNEADEAAKKAIYRETNKEMATTGARAVSVNPTAASQQAAHLGVSSGQELQTAIGSNRQAWRSVGRTRYAKAFAAAKQAGITIDLGEVDYQGNPITQSLQSAHRDLSDLTKTSRILKRAAATDPEKESARQALLPQIAEKRQQIQDAFANNPREFQQYTDAGAFWKAGKQKFDTPVIKGLENMTPDHIADTLLTGNGLKPTRIQSNAPFVAGATPPARPMMGLTQLVQAIRKAGPQAMPHIQEAVVHKLVANSTDAKSGWIVGQGLLQDLTDNEATLRAVLPQNYTQWRTFATELAHKQRSREDIGRIFMQLRQPSAIIDSASGKVTPLSAAILTIPAIMSRVMTSNKALDWLTTGFKTGWKGEIGAAALRNLTGYLGKESMDIGDEDKEQPTPNFGSQPLPEPPATFGSSNR